MDASIRSVKTGPPTYYDAKNVQGPGARDLPKHLFNHQTTQLSSTYGSNGLEVECLCKGQGIATVRQDKKARAVILPLLKAAEAEFPGASLPKPDNIVRNVNCARSVKFP